MINKQLLKPYEHMFQSAINQQYISGLYKHIFDTVLTEYRRASGDMYNYTISCSSCVLKLFTKCGTIYFNQVDEVVEPIVKEDIVTTDKVFNNFKMKTKK